ncbi:transposase [Streptomyces sp. NBC_01207]|uniref:transposase n=1 Tax=Streptomyces sp. NBC_01207 TaxID=2903772 RepID=UPI003FA39D17
MRRHELSDAEWALVQPLLPRSVRGRPRLDDRTVLNGIVWKFRTGVARRDVPERYGSWASLHTRFRRWAADETFERMLQAAQDGDRHHQRPRVEISRVQADSSPVGRVHACSPRCAAPSGGAGRCGRAHGSDPGPPAPDSGRGARCARMRTGNSRCAC